ncbi:putative leucine-rich repeat domain superfamily [Helianthus anomalus]
MICDSLQRAQVTGSYWSFCQYPTKIMISECDALSSLIPWYAAGQMKRLQELDIRSCSRMREVFENELMNCHNTNNVDEGSGAGTSLTSLPLTYSTTEVAPQLSNLKTVVIYECDLLQHIFTFNTLKTLSHLKQLKVKRCETIQVIVKEENKTSSSSSSEEVVVFPNLETLELDCLPNLKGFFLGMNDFRCPSLVTLMINDCPKWVVFTSGQLETPKLKYVHTSFGKHSLERGFNFQTTFPTSSKGMPSSFHNLIEINIENKEDVGRTIIPSNELQQVVKLQQITIKSCYGVKGVFEVVAVEGSGSRESKTLVPIPNLTQVKLDNVGNLKYLWKSNQWMVLEFPNLTIVHIHHCYKLEHVFTCSMVGSLVQLQELHISQCMITEVILKEEEEEEECDAKVNEIILPRLNSLKLEDLNSLKGFCLGKEAFSLPALDTLQIKDCPDITVFTKGHLSTPQLKVIDTDFGMCDPRKDVNSFIETKLEEVCINIITYSSFF